MKITNKQIEIMRNELLEIIKECEEFLENAPDGRVDITRIEDSLYYEHTIEKNKNRIRKGITRNASLVEDLVKKDYYKEKLRVAQQNLQALDALKNSFEPEVKKSALNSLPEWKQFVMQSIMEKEFINLERWQNQSYRTNSYKSEQKNIKTLCGVMVRSKSEREIANSLTRAGIPFRYEAELSILGNCIFPDFTILCPRDGRIYYWEHAGMMDSVSYMKNNSDRLAQYASIGIFPFDTLILSGETNEYPLDTSSIDRIITNFLI